MGQIWERYRGYIVFSLGWALLAGVLLLIARRPVGEPIEILPPPSPTPTATPAPLRVYVSGAVRSPDVYLLPVDAIVRDAIQAAGGATEDADLAAINLALPLADGVHVHVPRLGEATPAPGISGPVGGTAVSVAGGARINVNTATLEELDTLPGVGPTLAQRIIDHRPYSSPEDLLRVPGIGDATLARLRDLITVR